MSTLPLTRTDTGYVTRDGRFAITRTTMGGGVNGNRRWSEGQTAWLVEDTTGATHWRGLGSTTRRSSIILYSLWEARDAIAHIYTREQS